MSPAHIHHHDKLKCPHDSGHAPLCNEVKKSAASAAHAHHGHDGDHGDPNHDEHDHAHDHVAPGHDHHHGGHQHDYRSHDKSLLAISFVITLTTMAAEIIGGLLTHSLA